MGFASALFRSVIPSWSFFGKAGHRPILQVRSVTMGVEPGPWRTHTSFENQESPNRGLIQLFHHPEGNLHLAHRSLVGRSLEELNRVGDVDFFATETFHLLKTLAMQMVPQAKKWQFQISMVLKDGSQEEAFRSPIFDGQQGLA